MHGRPRQDLLAVLSAALCCPVDPRNSPARDAFLGIGDPTLEGPPGRTKGINVGPLFARRTVADTGNGIALADIPKALSPFSQIDSDLNRKYEGTGLGLPLTKALAELHGGSLDLQSEVDVGTTVTVRFPAERIVASLDNADSLDAADRAAR